MLLTVSFISIFLGACLQSSIGIGFSIIAVPSIIFLFGIDIAIPLLLALNFIVSLFSIDYRNILKRDQLIIYAIFGCSIGVILGIWLYGSLSEKQILTLISILMLSGILTVLTDIQLKISPWVFSGFFFVIGVSAVWTAVPGPLMAFALLASGKSADEVSVSIQPLALIVYGLSLLFHLNLNPNFDLNNSEFYNLIMIVVVGAILGQRLRIKMSNKMKSRAIMTLSTVSAMIIFTRVLNL